MDTIKGKPWGKGQGDFVVINAEDFDPKKHERYDPEAAAAGGDDQGDGQDKKMTVAELKEALTAKGIAIPEGAKKADLQALLDQSDKSE